MDGAPGSDADDAWLRNLVIRLSRASAGRVAALNYLIPVVAILLGWMYLGERPSILAVAGCSLCLVGVYVARHGRVKRRR